MGDTSLGLDPLGAASVTTPPVLRSISTPHHRRWVRRAVALALVVLALGWVYDGRARLVEREGATVFLQGRSYECWRSCATGAAGGAAVGTLGLVGGRCLGLNAGTADEVVLAWPAGSRVRIVDGRPAVEADGTTRVLGQEVGVPIDGSEGAPELRTSDWDAGTVPRACADVPLVEVVSP